MRTRLLDILCGYYALLQTLHFSLLIRELINFLWDDAFRILAPGPTREWSPIEIKLLFILGSLDALIIILSLILLVKYFSAKGTTLKSILGLLTAFHSTALAFLLVTAPSGAWCEHPWNYTLMVILFLPVSFLYMHLSWIWIQDIKRQT